MNCVHNATGEAYESNGPKSSMNADDNSLSKNTNWSNQTFSCCILNEKVLCVYNDCQICESMLEVSIKQAWITKFDKLNAILHFHRKWHDCYQIEYFQNLVLTVRGYLQHPLIRNILRDEVSLYSIQVNISRTNPRQYILRYMFTYFMYSVLNLFSYISEILLTWCWC